MVQISRIELIDLYVNQKLSSKVISVKFGCSENKINYCLKKFGIQKRTISEAIYAKRNPEGDPFTVIDVKEPEQYFLYGLGLGLYWGEGNKLNKNSVRLGNSDPDLILSFINFLQKIYNIDRQALHFGIQIFSEMDPKLALDFWCNKLNISKSQFYKVVVTPARGEGTYKRKVQHGVLTVYFNNTKLRNHIIGQIENIRKMY